MIIGPDIFIALLETWEGRKLDECERAVARILSSKQEKLELAALDQWQPHGSMIQ